MNDMQRLDAGSKNSTSVLELLSRNVGTSYKRRCWDSDYTHIQECDMLKYTI